MAKIQTVTENFLHGLQTTLPEERSSLRDFYKFLNVRVDEGDARRRDGRVLVDRAGTDQTAIVLNGSDQYILVPAAPIHDEFTLPLTIEIFFKPDSVTGTQVLAAFNHATDWPFKVWLNGTTITVTITDSGGSTQALTTSVTPAINDKIAFQMAMGDGSYTARVIQYDDSEGTLEAIDGSSTSITVGSTLKDATGDLYIGRDASGNYFDGTIDYFRVFATKRTQFRDGWQRFLDPRADFVLADYGGEINASDHVIDRSRFENHGTMQNPSSGGDTTTKLGHQTSPVQAIHPYVTRDGERRIVVVAGGLVYDDALLGV